MIQRWNHTHISILVVSCFFVVLCVWNKASLASDTPLFHSDMNMMQGLWVRADAPYLIELTENTNGELQASYFNRKSIHVEKTETAEKNGLLYVMVLLRDVNYQGSFYLLSYKRENDTLLGTYFHAASRQQFEVKFKRKK